MTHKTDTLAGNTSAMLEPEEIHKLLAGIDKENEEDDASAYSSSSELSCWSDLGSETESTLRARPSNASEAPSSGRDFSQSTSICLHYSAAELVGLFSCFELTLVPLLASSNYRSSAKCRKCSSIYAVLRNTDNSNISFLSR